MKPNEKSTQRFVKEYANWAIRNLEEMKKYREGWTCFDDDIGRIKKTVEAWENGIIDTREAMRVISEAY